MYQIIFGMFYKKKEFKVCSCVPVSVECVCVGVRPGIQSEDQNQYFTFKARPRIYI